MTQAKPTPGPWIVGKGAGYYITRPNSKCAAIMVGVCDQTSIVNGDCEPQAKANAELMAEAGTVFHETQLTPRQLLAQRDELLAVLKLVLPLAKGYAAQICVGSNQLYVTAAEEAIAKIESTQTKGEIK